MYIYELFFNGWFQVPWVVPRLTAKPRQQFLPLQVWNAERRIQGQPLGYVRKAEKGCGVLLWDELAAELLPISASRCWFIIVPSDASSSCSSWLIICSQGLPDLPGSTLISTTTAWSKLRQPRSQDFEAPQIKSTTSKTARWTSSKQQAVDPIDHFERKKLYTAKSLQAPTKSTKRKPLQQRATNKTNNTKQNRLHNGTHNHYNSIALSHELPLVRPPQMLWRS